MISEEDKIIYKDYREKNKNCEFCKYSKYHTYVHWTDCCFLNCELKDKFIKFPRIKAKMCKYYKVGEDKIR